MLPATLTSASGGGTLIKRRPSALSSTRDVQCIHIINSSAMLGSSALSEMQMKHFGIPQQTKRGLLRNSLKS